MSENEKIEVVTNDAFEAFWKVVKDGFPRITTGDMTPDQLIPFQESAKEAVRAWYNNNSGQPSIPTRILEQLAVHCRLCVEDPKIFCPRNVDVQCLECGERFCGGHIGQHLKEVHCIALDFSWCREPDDVDIEDDLHDTFHNLPEEEGNEV